MTRYHVQLLGYVVSLSAGTQMVSGTYEVDARTKREARAMTVALARAEVDEGSLVILDVAVSVVEIVKVRASPVESRPVGLSESEAFD